MGQFPFLGGGEDAPEDGGGSIDGGGRHRGARPRLPGISLINILDTNVLSELLKGRPDPAVGSPSIRPHDSKEESPEC